MGWRREAVSMRWTRMSFVVAVAMVPVAAWAQGNPIGPEFRVNTYTTSDQVRPMAASDGSGNFVVVWHSTDDSLTGVFGQRYAGSGAPLGSEFRVNSYTTNDQGLPSVAADPSGNFVVAWASITQDGSAAGIFGQRYDAAGTPLGPEFRVNTYTTGYQVSQSVAADSSGNFVVVWTGRGGQDGSQDGVFGQRYASSGTPLGPEFRVNSYTTGHQYRPFVSADSSGNFVVVWTGAAEDGSGYGVFGQRYAGTGAPLGAEFRVNTYVTGPQTLASVAAGTAGDFVVVWASGGQDGSGNGVFGQRYASSGTPLGPEFPINSFTTGDQQFPFVAGDAAGNFVVVWRSFAQDGSSWGVFGQRYAGSGATLGPEFRVNSYTTGSQYRPFVGADPAGDFVVVWMAEAQDGSGYGVYGQRYAPILPVELMHFGVE
jgi:hypothetical protein